jgi:PAS domain S-box-containing protein
MKLGRSEKASLDVISSSTGRRREEEDLRRLATVVRDSNDAITIQDFEGRITAWNHGAELMYGYSEAEALAMNIERLTGPGKVAEQKDLVRRLVAGEAITSFETQRVTKDGRILDVWMTVTKLVDKAGEVIGFATTERDITQRKRAEETARRLAAVVRDSNDAVTIQGFERQITAWNRGAELMYGYTEEEALKMGARRLTPPTHEAAQKDVVNRLMAGEAITSFETQRVSKDGRTLDVWMTITKLVDGAGEVIGFATTERDITQRKRAEEKQREELEKRVAQRTAALERSNKELEQFAYVASHDLQEPLRMVASYTQLLEHRYKDQLDDTAREFIRFAVDGASRMQRLINDLLAYSRVQTKAGEFETVDLNHILGQARTNLATAIEESSALVTNDELPIVMADPAQLLSVLQNLIGNAVKFHGEGLPHVHVSARETNDEIVVSVRDNGIGIRKEHQERIFHIFQRLHNRADYPGTGIGLALCKRIVERHGGRIWVESEEGKGATFTFTLPKGRQEEQLT